MLDYLVTSRARKLLLDALWAQKARGSVRRLARTTGLGFSTAYDELKEMERNALAVAVRTGSSLEYRANFSHPAAGLLLELLRGAEAQANDPAAGKPDSSVVYENLARLGAPLSVVQVTGVTLGVEETLVQALKLARRDPSAARSLPVAFARSRGRYSFERLKQLALSSNEKRTLGFYLDLTGSLLNDPAMRSEARELRDRRVKRPESFFVGAPKGKFLRRLERRNTPPLAKKWHFRMNLGMDSFESLFKKHRS